MGERAALAVRPFSMPDDLTTRRFRSHRDQGGGAMASLTTRQIAAADFSHDLSVEHSQSVDKRTSFDGVTLTFHWVTVMLVLGLFTTAIWHALSHDDVLRVMLLRIHRSLGVKVWMTTALRLIWRKTNAELPPFPEGMSQLHRALVQNYPTVGAVLFSLHRVCAWALGLLITPRPLNRPVHHFIIRDNTLARM